MNYWLMKTEPDTFSIQDLKKAKVAPWEGVRNYQARNFMQQMQMNDLVLIYHSSCAEIGVAGIAEVVKTAYPDPTALDPKSDYYDPKAPPDKPRWFMVDVKWIETFPRLIPLKELKENSAITELHLLQKGSRLSVMPVNAMEFKLIKKLGHQK